MHPTTILYILMIILLNAGMYWGLKAIRKKYAVGFKSHVICEVTRILVSLISLASIGAILALFDIKLLQLLNVNMFTIGDSVPISGFLLVFLFFTISFLIIINRFLTKIFHETRGRGMHSVPKRVTKVVRRWVSLIVFLILVQGVISLTHNTFNFFDIVVFHIQKVEITIGIILRMLLVIYTVHTTILVAEFFYDQRIYKTGIDVGKGHTVFQIVKYFAWVITIVVIIGNLGISVTVLLAGSAALFVGLGFGVQSLFNDFVSGLIILFEGTIRVKDVVELENGIVGKVQEIGLRTSKVLTRDNIITIIPNNNFVGKNVINWTYNDHKTRFKVDVGVAYGSDVRLVEKILIECALLQNKIHKMPKPFVYFNDFGDSSLSFSLFFWIDDSFWVEKVRSDLRFAINDHFKTHKIEIPFPQRDLHIRSGFKS